MISLNIQKKIMWIPICVNFGIIKYQEKYSNR